MCDLWKHTTATDTPVGAIPAQIAEAREATASGNPPVTQIKLYNAGSFFDPRAVPEADYDTIARLLHGLDRVIVESHPALIGSRVERFAAALDRRAPGTALEVAVGLETAHPLALERLNKRMTVAEVAAAADHLRSTGTALRIFLLIAPPFIAPDDQDAWLLRSIDAAVSCAATAVSLIPMRPGNGAVEALAREGLFVAPRLADVERSADAAHRHASGSARIFVDLWDLERLADCGHCLEARRERLHAINLEQRVRPPVACVRCGTSVAPTLSRQ